MRLKRQEIAKDGSGTVTLIPEEPEDMWTAYNLIRANDLLRASAIRRVALTSETGSSASHRVHTVFLIRVRSTDFDIQAAQLHVSGQIAAENPHAKIGQFHTLDLELNREFTIEKGEGWDSVSLGMLREATDPGRGAVAYAVVLQEGLANIAVLTSERTVWRQRVEVAIPRKRAGVAGGHDEGLERFFGVVLTALLRHVDLSLNLPILLASPGFTAQGLQAYVFSQASSTNNKALLGQKGNFILAHASSGHMHALAEVLGNPAVTARLSNTRFARESKLMDEFLEMVRVDDGRAWYGPREVEGAVARGAVGRGGGVLLISNKLFRAVDVDVRRRWVGLVEKVEEYGGEVRVLSSEHEAGKRLENLSGVAAILTFPVEGLDEGFSDEEEEGEDGGEVFDQSAEETERRREDGLVDDMQAWEF